MTTGSASAVRLGTTMSVQRESADTPIRLDRLLSLKTALTVARRRPPPITVVLGAILTCVISAAYVMAAVGLIASYVTWDVKDAFLGPAWLVVVVLGVLILVPVAWIGYRSAKFNLLGHPPGENLIPTVGVLLVCVMIGAGLLLELLTGEGAPWEPTMLYPLGLAVIGLAAWALFLTRSAKAFVAASKHLFPTVN